MKAKTLLLAGLSAFALASCGLKKYETKVSEEKFAEKLLEVSTKNKMINSDDFYSFKFEMEEEGKSVDTYYKNGKKLSKEIWEGESETTIKFDKSKSICKITAESERLHEKESGKEITEADLTQYYQCDSKALYHIYDDEKLYEKYEIANPADAVATEAFRQPKALIAEFSKWIGFADAYYIDDNVFTMEMIQDREDESVTKASKTVYQLVIEDDKIQYFEEEETLIKEVNLETETKNSLTWKFEKDDVSLKEVNLEKYLKISD